MNPRPGFECGGEQPSWLVRVMPYMEESASYDEWDVNKPYEDHPRAVRQRVLSSLICPTRRAPETAVVPPRLEWAMRYSSCGCGSMVLVRIYGGATGDYGGNHGDPSPGANGGPNDFYRGGNGTGVIISSRARCDGDQPTNWIDEVRFKNLTDGTSKTLLAGEMHVTPELLLTQPFDGPIYNGEDLAGIRTHRRTWRPTRT